MTFIQSGLEKNKRTGQAVKSRHEQNSTTFMGGNLLPLLPFVHHKTFFKMIE